MTEQKGYAEVNGARLYYETAGDGEPLVMIHGGIGLDRRMWDDQWAVFAAHYKVIRYDLRSCGKSALHTGKPFYQDEDLKALLDYLDITQTHVLGLSAGGQIAIDFALAYPEATRSLIVVGSGVDGYQFQDMEPWQALADIKAEIIQAGIGTHKHLALNHAIFAPAMAQPDVAARLRQMMDDYSGWMYYSTGLTNTPHNPPAIQSLDNINAPTLIIVGERELTDTLAMADILEQRILNSQKVIMLGIGHMSNMEAPERFNEIVLNFLATTW